MNNIKPHKKKPDKKIYWLHIAALSLLLLLMGSYFYSWKITSEEIEKAHIIEDEKSAACIKTDSVLVKGKTEQEDLVAVGEMIPAIKIELKYATGDNFTGKRIYEDDAAYLRRGTVQKLAKVQAELEDLGYSLKIWDAYRPVSAQYKLWEVCPDERFVANPHKGFSNHSRGTAVDVTLVDKDGQKIAMPSGFDEFGSNCDRDYSDIDGNAASNAMLLEDIMHKNGFVGLETEWWHFDDIDTLQYSVIDELI